MSPLNEARLAGIVDSAMDAIISVDKEQRIMLFNSAAETMFDCAATEVLGQSLERFLPGHVRTHHGHYIEEFGSKGVTSRRMGSLGTLTAVRSSGQEFPIEASISQAQAGDQQVFTVILRDISERQLAFQAIQERERRLESVIENLAEGLILMTASGETLHWNQAAKRLHDFTDPAQWDRQLAEFHTVFELSTLEGEVIPVEQWPVPRILAGETLRDWVLRLRRLDRDWERIFSYGGSLISDHQGQPVALLGITDITERHQAKQALQDSENRLSAVTENLSEGLIMADLDGRLIHWNKAGLEMHGYHDLEDGLGLWSRFATAFELYTLDGTPVPPEQWPLVRVLSGESLGALELRIRRPDISLDRIFQFTGDIIVDVSGKPLAFMTITDVTEERMAQNKVHELNAELEQRVAERTAQLQRVNDDLEAFSYSVSHDLRAPLRAIDGFSLGLVEDYHEQLPADGQRRLGIVRRSAQRMGKLIDDLLAFSQLDRASLNKVILETRSLVDHAVNQVQSAYEHPDLRLEIAELLPSYGDAALLRQVWINLISNAVKYSSQRPETVVEIGSRSEGTEHIYYVKDYGAGFEMQYADKLFGVFQRLHRQEDFEGTGVGLAIVKRVIERHQGRVWAEAELDKGATFYFALPAGVAV